MRADRKTKIIFTDYKIFKCTLLKAMSLCLWKIADNNESLYCGMGNLQSLTFNGVVQVRQPYEFDMYMLDFKKLQNQKSSEGKRVIATKKEAVGDDNDNNVLSQYTSNTRCPFFFSYVLTLQCLVQLNGCITSFFRMYKMGLLFLILFIRIHLYLTI